MPTFNVEVQKGNRAVSVSGTKLGVSNVDVDNLVGPAGPPGPPGPPGVSGYYFHQQGVPALTWVIPHNLGYRPNVTTFSSVDEEIVGNVTHTDVNSLVVDFAYATSGYAAIS